MNPTLRERLIRLEQQFLLAVASNDEESLKGFSQEWFQLARDIANTKTTGRLDDNTAHLLFKVSQAIENMIVCMLESGSILQESMTCSISDIIQDIPPGDPPLASLHTQAIAPYHLLFSKVSSPMNSTILGQQKLLDAYAYCWLMHNIHHPYPDSTQRQIISDVSGTSTAQVEFWFQEARDSIGWNKLSRNFFAGSVNATVATARRVYLERDENISFDIVFAFTAVKAFAETLFLENPLLQGKNVDIASALAIRTNSCCRHVACRTLSRIELEPLDREAGPKQLMAKVDSSEDVVEVFGRAWRQSNLPPMLLDPSLLPLFKAELSKQTLSPSVCHAVSIHHPSV